MNRDPAFVMCNAIMQQQIILFIMLFNDFDIWSSTIFLGISSAILNDVIR